MNQSLEQLIKLNRYYKAKQERQTNILEHNRLKKLQDAHLYHNEYNRIKHFLDSSTIHPSEKNNA